MTDDPTVSEVWKSIPDDIRKLVYVMTDALVKQKHTRSNLARRVKELNKNQQTVIFYLLGEAMESKLHPIDAGKSLLLVKDEWLDS